MSALARGRAASAPAPGVPRVTSRDFLAAWALCRELGITPGEALELPAGELRMLLDMRGRP